MYTSTTFVAPKSCSQTRERSMSRESARRAFCAMNTKSSYSRAVNSILLSPRRTMWAAVSIYRSATRRISSPSTRLSSARMRAINSPMS
jgi:hypothetical protein